MGKFSAVALPTLLVALVALGHTPGPAWWRRWGAGLVRGCLGLHGGEVGPAEQGAALAASRGPYTFSSGTMRPPPSTQVLRLDPAQMLMLDAVAGCS
jgi:hypothetical protein